MLNQVSTLPLAQIHCSPFLTDDPFAETEGKSLRISQCKDSLSDLNDAVRHNSGNGVQGKIARPNEADVNVRMLEDQIGRARAAAIVADGDRLHGLGIP